MCLFKSGVAVKSGDGVRVYTLRGDDSHASVREHYHIRDDNGAGAQYQTPVALVPIKSLRDVSTYEFWFDDERPTWWTDEMTLEARQQLERAVKQEDVEHYPSSLNLSLLTALPRGARLGACGNLDLRSITKLPVGARIKAGGDLDLRSLTTLPKGVRLSAGEDLNLCSVTTMSQRVRLRAGYFLVLSSLTTLPVGVNFEVNGILDLRSVTQLPEGVSLDAYSIDLSSLTVLPKGARLRASKDIDLRSVHTLAEDVQVRAWGELGSVFLCALTTMAPSARVEARCVYLNSRASLPWGARIKGKRVF